jgi:hypothetical protein
MQFLLNHPGMKRGAQNHSHLLRVLAAVHPVRRVSRPVVTKKPIHRDLQPLDLPRLECCLRRLFLALFLFHLLTSGVLAMPIQATQVVHFFDPALLRTTNQIVPIHMLAFRPPLIHVLELKYLVGSLP